MEEDLKLLEEMKNNCLIKRDYIDEKAERKAQAIENLINKYKEQEKHIKALDSVIVEHIEKNKEQEKMIELMALSISNYDSQLVINTFKDKEDVKEFFRKKAKGE